MDSKTIKELQKISRKVTKDMGEYGLTKVDLGPSTYEMARDAYKVAKTNRERQALDEIMRKTEGEEQKESLTVNEEYNKIVEQRMDYEIRKAVSRGKIKMADRDEYRKYMNKIHKK